MNPIPFLHPVPITIIGIFKANGEANFTTIGDVAVAGLNPPLLMLSLHERHLIRERLDETKVCSINVPEIKHMAKVDYCGMHSGRNTDKNHIFKYKAHRENVPVVSNMPFVIVGKVRERMQVETRVIYILDVIDTIINDKVKNNGPSSVKTLLYGLDNHYYSSGDVVGTGYQEGMNIKK